MSPATPRSGSIGARTPGLSPSPILSSIPRSSLLDPLYIGPNAATAVLASDCLVQAHRLTVRPPHPAALAILNAFLDHLVFLLLTRARSSLIDPLRTATRKVFKNQLAEDAIAEGEAELRTYIRTPDEEIALLGTGPVPPNAAFDAELAWQMARVRCMVYSSVGDIEEADVLRLNPEQRSLFSAGDPNDPSDLISPIATIFLTAILEFVAEHALLVAGRAVLSRYLVTAASSSQFTGPRLLVLEEGDVEKLALDPQLGKVWRQWRKRHRGTPASPGFSSPPAIPSAPSTPQTPMTPLPREPPTPKLTNSLETIYLTPNGNNKKVRPISVDNGVLSLDDVDKEDDSPSSVPASSQDGVSIPVTPATIRERRKSRPWSFHGQRFSLYESFAAMAGAPFGKRPTDQDRKSSPIEEQVEKSAFNVHPADIVPGAFPTDDSAIKTPSTPRIEPDSVNGCESDSNRLSPTTSCSRATEEDSDLSQTADNETDLNATDFPSVSRTFSAKSKADDAAPVILLASAPAGYNSQYTAHTDDEALIPSSSASSGSLSSLKRQSNLSVKIKRGVRTSAETAVPGFNMAVPSEKVRKYIWISNQKFEDDDFSGARSDDVGEADGDLEHVTFERLLKSDITYKLNLTPDKLREAKPFYTDSYSKAEDRLKNAGDGLPSSHLAPSVGSSSAAPVSEEQLSTGDEEQKRILGSPVVLQAPKHTRDDSFKATVGATQDLMDMLSETSSNNGAHDDKSPRARTEWEKDGHEGDGTDPRPEPQIQEEQIQPQRQPRRKTSIMSRLGFSGIALSKEQAARPPPLPSPRLDQYSLLSSHSLTNSSSERSSYNGVSGIGIYSAHNELLPRDETISPNYRANSELASFLRDTGPDGHSRYMWPKSEVDKGGTAVRYRQSQPASNAKKSRKSLSILGFLKASKNGVV